MSRSLALLVVSLWPTSSEGADAPALYVAPSSVSPALEQILRTELDELVLVSTPADAKLAVSVVAQSDRITLTLTTPDGTSVLARELDAKGGIQPALRAAALIVADAVQNAPPPGLASAPAALPEMGGDAARAPPMPLGLQFSAGPSFTTWARPFAPQLGLTAGARASGERWSFGLRLGFAGAPCCAFETEAVKGASRSFSVFARAELRVYGSPHVDLSPLLDVGTVFQQVRARAVFAGGESPTQVSSAWSPALRLGAALDGRLGAGLGWGVHGGVALYARRLRVALPALVSAANPPVDAGWLAPWVELVLSYRVR